MFLFTDILDLGSTIISTFSQIGVFFTTPIDVLGGSFTPIELMFGIGLGFVLIWIIANFFIPN